ncbi:MAG: type I glyceraldehyde-3-phosphate dehydrogenase [Dehalococcoidia bacterium]
MATKVGINGFGRIGRQVLKAMMERHPQELEVVAINDLADSETNAHLFRFDSTYRRYKGVVAVENGNLRINGNKLKVFSERDPGQIPWGDVGAQIVVESTGVFTDGEKAKAHLRETVGKVVISAPAKNEDLTIVLGVNDSTYDASKHHVLSNASCTTNCIAPMVKVLHDNFGVKRGFMSTIHAYTTDQNILDLVHTALRRARAAAVNIIPTTTGAARAVTIVMPELKGRIDGMAFRVPVQTGSVTDFVADLEQDVTVDELNKAFQDAAAGALKGILEFESRELVSSDFIEQPASSIIDGPSTMVLQGSMVKTVSWYDNEWGYSCRTSDLCAMLAKKGW